MPRLRLIALTGLAIALTVLLPASARAQTVPCSAVAAYPGDTGPKTAIAQWMAYGAASAGIPRELPVMGALVESALQNLAVADSDAAGYFQMRRTIWNKGEYAGYPENPSLQMKWFVDRAAQFRTQWIAAGRPDPAGNELVWGEWIADVLLPAENRRHLYQQQLAEARTLVGAPCTPPASPGVPSPMPLPSPADVTADVTAPAVRISGAGSQRSLLRGAIVLSVRCPAEPCTSAATATIALPGARRALRIVSPSRTAAASATRRLRFVLSMEARRRLRGALRSRPVVTAAVRIVVRDLAGNRVVRKRSVRLTR